MWCCEMLCYTRNVAVYPRFPGVMLKVQPVLFVVVSLRESPLGS